MSLSSSQSEAFSLNSGFTTDQLSYLCIGFFFAVLILWGVWAIKTAYSGWVTKQISHKEFVMVIVRFALIYCVLTFLLLS